MSAVDKRRESMVRYLHVEPWPRSTQIWGIKLHPVLYPTSGVSRSPLHEEACWTPGLAQHRRVFVDMIWLLTPQRAMKRCLASISSQVNCDRENWVKNVKSLLLELALCHLGISYRCFGELKNTNQVPLAEPRPLWQSAS